MDIADLMYTVDWYGWFNDIPVDGYGWFNEYL